MRHQIPKITRDFKPPEQSFFLLGPRGTGKSTWLRQHFPDALWIDFLEPDLFAAYSAKPQRLRDVVLSYPEKNVVVIDEVQKIPEILSLVHALIEEKRGIQFILTGSSSRKLKRHGVDLLAGRALLYYMHPFIASELGDLFNLENSLKHGLLPLVLDSPNPEAVLKAYSALYLKEEIIAEGLVRNIGSYARFLEVISFSHGGVLNTSNIARECNISRPTVDTYIQILKDILLGFTIPVFTKRAQRALSSHPKFYLFDSGVYYALRPKGPVDRPEEIGGASLEGLVAQHLKAWIDAQELRYDLSFWRTRSGVEVDFIVYGEGGFWAIEVKNGKTLSPKDTDGLKSFIQDYPEAKPILLYRGSERILQNGILCLPCEEFLRDIRPDAPIK